MFETLSNPLNSSAPSNESRQPVLMVPIRSLGENHRARIGLHLKALSAHDRYYRFGFAASDEQVQRYVDKLDFERDEIFGIYNRRLELIAMAHLAYVSADGPAKVAEFGVSVLAQARGRQYGARLFERAVMHARNAGVSTLYVHVLSENTAMLKIARHAGAVFVRDGSESEGHLKLPAATMNTHLTEMFEEQLAQTNYQIKVQAKQIHDTFTGLQTAWRSVTGAEKTL
jgi:RimJ/RimL family protein N-acetyltransferase